MATVSITDAATRLGISPDTVRRHIGNGKLTGHQEPTAQGFRWQVEVPENGADPGPPADPIPGPGPTNGEAEVLRELVATLQGELAAKNGQIQELHVLLQQQAALPAPKESRRWWQFWG